MILSDLKDSINFAVESINRTPVREHNGVRYQIFENFFDISFLKKLEQIEDTDVKLELLEMQEKQNRRLVSYAEPVSKNLQVFFHSSKIINALKKKFNCVSLVPKTTDMWFDYKDYQIKPHIDEGYQLQLQIYLNNEKQPPTAFYEKLNGIYNVFDSAEYKSNYGYCLYNSGPSWHGMTDKVISGKRKSVFARFE